MKVAYHEKGSGPPLVLLHGVGVAGESYEGLLDALSDRFRVVAWDQPGYGASPDLPEVTFPALAGALKALLDDLGLEAVHLFGHSLGGMVAQEFAALHAERLRSLVLSATSPAFGNPDGAFQRDFVAKRVAPLDAGLTMAEVAEAVVPQLVGDDPDPAGVAAAIAACARVRPETYRTMMQAITRFDRRAELAGIAVPTLVVAGEKDSNAPAPMMARMAERIPGARYVEMAGAGHLAYLERPAAFAQILRDFLDSLEGRA